MTTGDSREHQISGEISSTLSRGGLLSPVDYWSLQGDVLIRRHQNIKAEKVNEVEVKSANASPSTNTGDSREHQISGEDYWSLRVDLLIRDHQSEVGAESKRLCTFRHTHIPKPH